MILYSKNADAKMYPASTTKILTAILAIEKCNLDDKVVVPKSIASAIPPGYSSGNLVEGEELSIDELLKMLLVHSANDAAVVLAEHISGTVENFSNLMNEKAISIGCKNSHFVNPNGIHDENHYTTSSDLSLIAKYCMQNETFKNYVSLAKCTINSTNKSSVRQYSNTNELLNKSSKYYITDCIGIKTGFTTEAKNCLISAFNKNNLELISVTLGGDYLPNGNNARFVDGKTLYNYAYSNYSIETIAEKGEIIENVEISNGNKETRNLDLILGDDLRILIRKDEEIPSPNIMIDEPLKAPINQNQKVGTATYFINDTTYTQDLIASHNVEKKEYFILILAISLGLIVFLILIIMVIRLNKTKKRKKKYYENY